MAGNGRGSGDIGTASGRVAVGFTGWYVSAGGRGWSEGRLRMGTVVTAATWRRRARGRCQVCSTSSSMRSAVVPSFTSVNSGLHVRSIASSSTCRAGRERGERGERDEGGDVWPCQRRAEFETRRDGAHSSERSRWPSPPD